jgi:hypothetical protein
MSMPAARLLGALILSPRFQNTGPVTVTGNDIDGNLHCKENEPEPVGGGNDVQGNKEAQCEVL